MKRNPSTSQKPKDSQPDTRFRGKERLELVFTLLEQVWSQRQIAEGVGWDEGTIRRDIAKLSLPKGELAAIESGEPAEKYLNEARLLKDGKDRGAAARQRRRVWQEKRDGRHSTSLSVAILEWMAKKDLFTANEQRILWKAKREINVSKDHWKPPLPKFGDILAQLMRVICRTKGLRKSASTVPRWWRL